VCAIINAIAHVLTILSNYLKFTFFNVLITNIGKREEINKRDIPTLSYVGLFI